MESLEFYVKLAESSGLVVDRIQDISAETLPTFECWRRNAHSNRDRVIELVGATYWSQFIHACDFLTALWQSNKLGYGMLLARRDAKS